MNKNYCLILFFLIYNLTFSQLLVTDGHVINNTLHQIAQKIVGKGIKISNITYNGANLNQAGTFVDATKSLGFKNGSIFTTGRASIANPPNDIRIAEANLSYSVQDPNLKSIFNFLSVSDNIYDQFVLEFDFVAASDSLRINYIFGSEEYNEFIGYRNDAAAIFISGPGIVGIKNIAILPNNDIIAVNTIHQGIATPVSLFDYYWENPKTDMCNNCQYFVFNPANATNTQYDGFTLPLKAKAKLIPCQTYHLKIAIADALDNVKDSGLIIEGAGISSTFLQSNFQNIKDTISICQTDIRPILTANTGYLAYQWFYNQSFTGNATNTITTSLAGFYRINITTSGNCTFADSVYLKTGNDFELTTTCKDTLICNFNVITIASKVNIFDTYTYKWSNNNSNKFYTSTQALTTKTYTVTATNFGGCTKSAQVTVSVNPVFYSQNPTASASILCEKNAISIASNFAATDVFNSTVSVPSGVVNYWIQNSNSTAIGTNTVVLKPTFLGINTITSKIITPEGCVFENSISFNVIKKILRIKLAKDTICNTQKTQLFSTVVGANSLQWRADASLSNTTISSPFAQPTVNTQYFVTAKYALPIGCTATDSILLIVNPLPSYIKTADTSICMNKNVLIKVSTTNAKVLWKDSVNLTSSFIRNISKDTKYYFTITTNNKCSSKDSILIFAKPNPILQLGNDTSLCSNQKYRLKVITMSGILNWKSDIDIPNITLLSQIVKPTISKNYYAFTTNLYGCTATDSIKVTVFDLPKLPILSTTQDFICEISQNYTQILAKNFVSYNWNTKDTSQNIKVISEGIYTVTVTDFNGCKNSDFVQILSNCTGIYKIPNIITPNGDNSNDVFFIQGLDLGSTLKIVNRWGMEVYFSTNYANDWQANQLPDGIYFYEYLPLKSNIKYKGWLEVIR